jgi:N-acetylmuramoyl-L-alanine amidase
MQIQLVLPGFFRGFCRLFLALSVLLCYYAADMRTLIKLAFLFVLTLSSAALSAEKGMTVKNVRYFSYPAFTRIVFEVDAAAPYVLTKSTDGKSFTFTAYDLPLIVKAQLPVIRDGVVNGVEMGQDAGRNVILVRLDAAAGEAKDFVLRAPDRIVLDIARGAAATPVPQAGGAITVVLDPGHGGRDTGIVTAQGPEKTFTLDIALAVKKILQKNPLLHVALTRGKDQALPLDERAAISNAARASLFVSIHGAPGESARVSIQDLFDDPSAQAAVRPASGDFLGFEAGSEQQQMLWGRQQSVRARESGELARSLALHLGGKDGAGPVQVPLAGLKAVDAAAIMVEVGMMKDRSKIAEAIAGGIEQYVREGR